MLQGAPAPSHWVECSELRVSVTVFLRIGNLSHDMTVLRARFLNLSISTGLGEFVVGGFSVHVGCLVASLTSIHQIPVPALCPQHSSYDNKNISRHFQISLRGRSKISSILELLICSLMTTSRALSQECASWSALGNGLPCLPLWKVGKPLAFGQGVHREATPRLSVLFGPHVPMSLHYRCLPHQSQELLSQPILLLSNFSLSPP